MPQALEHEEAQVKALFERVERVEAVAEKIRDQEAAELRDVALAALNAAPPVRLRIAASLLDLSDRTVRVWADEGLLPLVEEHPKRVDPVQLHRVLHLVRELRAAGRNRDLLNAVWYRLQDVALIDREDLATSIRQLKTGQLKPAMTKDEELAQQGQ
jgi:hypothetical protein